MKILQIGPPKCGNFWLYKILQQILKLSGNPSSSFIQQHPIQEMAKNWELNYPEQAQIDQIDITDLQTVYRISSIFRMPIDDWSAYLSKTNHVWTHSPFCKSSGQIFEFFDKKVFIIRDPRDMAISASKYYCSEYMLKYFPQEETDPERFLEKNFDNLLQEWVWHVWDHLRVSREYNIHIAYFEGFLQDFQEELSLLLNYFGTSLTSAEKFELEKSVSFSTLKKKNPKHLKKGALGYWKDQLTDYQISRAEIIAGPLLEYLNYSGDIENISFRRDFPQKNFEQLKAEIVDSQQPLFN